MAAAKMRILALGYGLAAGFTHRLLLQPSALIDLSARAADELVPECFVCGVKRSRNRVATKAVVPREGKSKAGPRRKELKSQHAAMSSSQPTSGTPFSVAADLQPCRLLELPPDLLEYLSTSDAPTLSFKARDATDPEAFLTTDHKTYLIRQVHTSNTLYITSPSQDAPGTTAISQCRSALECLPAPVRHAEDTLRSLLTTFAHPQDIDIRPSHPRSKSHVFAHTPMSHAECQSVWKDLVAFEHSGQSFRPTAATLASVWKWLLEIAYANAVNLADSVQKATIDKMLGGEDEWPRTLVDAIFLKLSADHSGLLQLQQQATVKWVGNNTLEAHREENKQSFMETSVFLDAWKDALPESWRPDVSLDMLKASSLDRDQRIQLISHRASLNYQEAENASSSSKAKVRMPKKPLLARRNHRQIQMLERGNGTKSSPPRENKANRLETTKEIYVVFFASCPLNRYPRHFSWRPVPSHIFRPKFMHLIVKMLPQHLAKCV
jgi:sister chromatid cohesion protein DCC1